METSQILGHSRGVASTRSPFPSFNKAGTAVTATAFVLSVLGLVYGGHIGSDVLQGFVYGASAMTLAAVVSHIYTNRHSISHFIKQALKWMREEESSGHELSSLTFISRDAENIHVRWKGYAASVPNTEEARRWIEAVATPLRKEGQSAAEAEANAILAYHSLNHPNLLEAQGLTLEFSEWHVRYSLCEGSVTFRTGLLKLGNPDREAARTRAIIARDA